MSLSPAVEKFASVFHASREQRTWLQRETDPAAILDKSYVLVGDFASDALKIKELRNAPDFLQLVEAFEADGVKQARVKLENKQIPHIARVRIAEAMGTGAFIGTLQTLYHIPIENGSTAKTGDQALTQRIVAVVSNLGNLSVGLAPSFHFEHILSLLDEFTRKALTCGPTNQDFPKLAQGLGDSFKVDIFDQLKNFPDFARRLAYELSNGCFFGAFKALSAWGSVDKTGIGSPPGLN